MCSDQSGTSPDIGLRDPGHASYSESPGPGNMMYLSFSNSGLCRDAVAGGAQIHQNHIELPVATTIISPDLTTGNSDMVPSCLGNHSNNAWKDGRSEMLFMQTDRGSIIGTDDLLHADDPQTSLQTQLSIIHGLSLSLQHSNVTLQNRHLSLSLSTQMPVPSIQYPSTSSNIPFIDSNQLTSGNVGPFREEHFQTRNFHDNASPNGLTSLTRLIPNSKYLRAAQELLDEVVNVRKALKRKTDKSQSHPTSAGTITFKDGSGGSKSEGLISNPQEATVNWSSGLSPLGQQDLQNKVTNWFINARVRLWKPMIEDMYKEEFGDTEIDSNSSENPSKLKEDFQSSEDHEDLRTYGTGRYQTGQISNSSRPITMNVAESAATFQHDASAQDSHKYLKASEQRPIGEDSGFLQDAIDHPEGKGRFLAYQMA
ncbi:hypothetical protein BHE74_00020272 [Ensete ventricosum]|uniref:Uncharacterized protein n=1 Tax=Ensete ventricosum TaxID=4639 RepID=A0A427AJ97_ENSVE|nr:hypothetical protein B296_00019103 [Ensete ventricosum]RWW12830.1 hypothetical protein GW17_00023495 [Ensete ventricosum]RWW71962.1 hypothetical protein BHE74_00020272 [Ensete ventricosum]RZR78663.1 hypothetical protein BHM03_00004083 [Ensete ventricosum]